MTKIIEWEDFKKDNIAYLKNQNIKNPSLSEVFKLGQLAFIAQIAETLNCSLTYNGLDWIDEIGCKLKEERVNKEFDPLSLVGGDLKLDTSLDFTYDGVAL